MYMCVCVMRMVAAPGAHGLKPLVRIAWVAAPWCAWLQARSSEVYRSFNSLGECMGASERGVLWEAEVAAQAWGW